MSDEMYFTSLETLSESRSVLDAHGYDCSEQFMSEPFETSARATNDRLYFGDITYKEQFALAATGLVRWNTVPDTLEVLFSWDKPQRGIQICKSEVMPFSVTCDFDKPVNALKIQSRQDRTLVAFGNVASDGSCVSFEPVRTDFNVSEFHMRTAQDVLVSQHLDRVVAGKLTTKVFRVLNENAYVELHPSARLSSNVL